jgi:hypothetical protein
MFAISIMVVFVPQKLVSNHLCTESPVHSHVVLVESNLKSFFELIILHTFYHFQNDTNWACQPDYSLWDLASLNLVIVQLETLERSVL